MDTTQLNSGKSAETALSSTANIIASMLAAVKARASHFLPGRAPQPKLGQLVQLKIPALACSCGAYRRMPPTHCKTLMPSTSSAGRLLLHISTASRSSPLPREHLHAARNCAIVIGVIATRYPTSVLNLPPQLADAAELGWLGVVTGTDRGGKSSTLARSSTRSRKKKPANHHH